MLRILEQKKVVGSRPRTDGGRGHLYFPLIPKDHYEATSLQHLVAKVFSGEPSSLVRRLIESESLSGEELKAIRALKAKTGCNR
jgi:predicted transcriptional regulator